MTGQAREEEEEEEDRVYDTCLTCEATRFAPCLGHGRQRHHLWCKLIAELVVEDFGHPSAIINE